MSFGDGTFGSGTFGDPNFAVTPLTYLLSTSLDPRGTATDPLRVVRSHQNIGGVAFDVLSCGHRYAAATGFAHTAPIRGEPGVTATMTVVDEHARRCPYCGDQEEW